MSKKTESGKGKPGAPPKAKPRPKAAAPTKTPRRTAPTDEEALQKAEQKPLLPTEEVFVAEYMVHLKANHAYAKAHPHATPLTCRTEGCRTLARPNVARKIAELRAAQMERLQLDADETVRGIRDIAEADHRALSEYRYLCCRHCWGQNFGYQRTQGEMDKARDEFEEAESKRETLAIMKDRPYTPREFNEKGGVGYNRWREPNPECPECCGVGVGRNVIKDTSKLAPDAVNLFAGIKETKDGIEVKMHDKLRAKDMLMKHQGLYEADNVQKSSVPEKSPEEWAALYDTAIDHALRTREEMQARRKRIEELDERERFGTAGGAQPSTPQHPQAGAPG
ncbi:MAG: terminase small subunit [Proteobacteria bacterium]|nr:terminase small subunit [Pseudomonadota bacterium]